MQKIEALTEAVNPTLSDLPLEFQGLPDNGDLKRFLMTIEKLGVSRSQIQGNVFVIGPGNTFPERALLFTPPEFKTTLKPDIDELSCCDSSYGHLDLPIELPTKILEPHVPPTHSRAIVNFYQFYSCEQVLKHRRGSIDTILFLRIRNLERQLVGWLWDTMLKSMRSGGFIICSGGASSDIQIPSGFEVIRLLNLPNPDYSSYEYSPEHIGMILQKVKK